MLSITTKLSRDSNFPEGLIERQLMYALPFLASIPVNAQKNPNFLEEYVNLNDVVLVDIYHPIFSRLVALLVNRKRSPKPFTSEPLTELLHLSPKIEIRDTATGQGFVAAKALHKGETILFERGVVAAAEVLYS